MEWNSEIFISTKYRKEDFISLRLDMDSDKEIWNKAIEIFKDRMEGRFFCVIDRLIRNRQLEIEGFSVMAINCLLIETLLQFREGWENTPYRRNAQEYREFLRIELGAIFKNTRVAQRFYTDIRCGILHSAQTKGYSRLSTDRGPTIIEINNGQGIKVEVIGLSFELRKYFDAYLETLKDSENKKLRYNFLKKMKFICRELN